MRMQAFAWFLDIKQGLKEKEHFDPYFIFLIAMLKITPNFIFSLLKLGGASYNVPIAISEHKRIVFSVK
jgi:ribosomal protein S7